MYHFSCPLGRLCLEQFIVTISMGGWIEIMFDFFYYFIYKQNFLADIFAQFFYSYHLVNIFIHQYLAIYIILHTLEAIYIK